MSELTGKTIGPYQLVELIDEGGDALIYKSFQPNMNRYVALKILKPGAARNPGTVQAFSQVGEIAAQIQNPNILTIFDSGQIDGTYYRAIPFMEAGSLGDNLGLFYEPRQALILIDGINHGLEAIYNQGYIHGNLSPSNIFLGDQRQPLLSDFGIPRQAREAPTPYSSPEQVQGGAIDRRTDVYALGVLLYTLLVGEAPPAGVVASPRAKRPDLPESIDRVVFKALAQNPDARFQSPVEFRNALDSALRPVAPTVQPTPVQPAATSQATPPPAKKSTNWMTIILGGVVVVAVVCLCAVALGLVMNGTIARSTPAATQPIEVTVVLPTNEPRPTKPEQPAPTEPPELPEPTAPPIEPPPTEPVEPAPTEPGEQPDQGLPPSGNLPDLCGSAGFIGGAAILGGVMMTRKRRK